MAESGDKNSRGAGPAEDADSSFDPREYETMVILERLESLEEEMGELGVTSLDEVRQRIAALHAQLDEV